MDYCEKFRKENPDKKITFTNFYQQAAGTTKYGATWWGDWTEEELINYADNGTGNYGGRLESVRTNIDGSKTGTICVYYD